MSAINRNAGLLCGLLACTLGATAGTPPPARKQAVPNSAAQAVSVGQPAPLQQSAALQPTAPVVPEPPKAPEQLPATPPKVTMSGGQLSIVADNSTLADVLNAVKKLTGAGVELPNAAGYERIVAQLGPGQPQQVLGQLLTGSKFDYIILGSADNPDAIQKIILTPRGASVSGPAPAANASMGAQQRTPSELGLNEPAPDAGVDDEVQQEPPQPEPPPPQTEEPPQPQPGAQQNNQNGPKTPEQLLQELQRLQQQGQNGRPQQ